MTTTPSIPPLINSFSHTVDEKTMYLCTQQHVYIYSNKRAFKCGQSVFLQKQRGCVSHSVCKCNVSVRVCCHLPGELSLCVSQGPNSMPKAVLRTQGNLHRSSKFSFKSHIYSKGPPFTSTFQDVCTLCSYVTVHLTSLSDNRLSQK